MRPMVLMRMLSVSSLYANSAADVDKGAESTKNMYESALEYLPYMKRELERTKGQVSDERHQAMDRFRKWRDSGYKVGGEEIAGRKLADDYDHSDYKKNVRA